MNSITEVYVDMKNRAHNTQVQGSVTGIQQYNYVHSISGITTAANYFDHYMATSCMHINTYQRRSDMHAQIHVTAMTSMI